jgi:hypothetical protein
MPGWPRRLGTSPPAADGAGADPPETGYARAV